MAQEIKDSKVTKKKKDFVKFFKEVKGELTKVIWPSRSQLINNTVTVLMCCIIVGAVIWVVDFGLKEAYQRVFNK